MIKRHLKHIRLYFNELTNKLRRTETWITLGFLIIGIIAGAWKYGIEATILTFFIFFSALAFADLVSDTLLFLTNRLKQDDDFQKGRKAFFSILLTLIVVVHLILWIDWVTKYSVAIGTVFGMLIFFLIPKSKVK